MHLLVMMSQSDLQRAGTGDAGVCSGRGFGHQVDVPYSLLDQSLRTGLTKGAVGEADQSLFSEVNEVEGDEVGSSVAMKSYWWSVYQKDLVPTACRSRRGVQGNRTSGRWRSLRTRR